MKEILMDTLLMKKSHSGESTYRGYYTPIADNYNSLTKEQLRDIIKELDYAISSTVSPTEYNQIIRTASYELLEQELIEY